MNYKKLEYKEIVDLFRCRSDADNPIHCYVELSGTFQLREFTKIIQFYVHATDGTWYEDTKGKIWRNLYKAFPESTTKTATDLPDVDYIQTRMVGITPMRSSGYAQLMSVPDKHKDASGYLLRHTVPTSPGVSTTEAQYWISESQLKVEYESTKLMSFTHALHLIEAGYKVTNVLWDAGSWIKLGTQSIDDGTNITIIKRTPTVPLPTVWVGTNAELLSHQWRLVK